MKTIFFSFARGPQDHWNQRIVDKLRHLETSQVVRIWRDERDIVVGEEWKKEIRSNIARADAILIAVSHSYLKSIFIRESEWPWLAERMAEVPVFWVPVDAGIKDLEGTIFSSLCGLQNAIREVVPLKGRTEREADSALHSLAVVISDWALSAQTAPPNSQGKATDDKGVRRASEKYLEAIFSHTQYLPVGNLGEGKTKSLLLDKVYVELEADPTSLEERLQTKTLFSELAEEQAEFEERAFHPHREYRDRIAEVLRERGPHYLPADSVLADKRITLQEVFRQNRVLVVLGDPGSGKSVLCRWLANQMSRRMLGIPSSSFAAADLGPPRFPVFIRVSKFAADISPDAEAPDLLTYIENNSLDVFDRVPDGLTKESAGRLCSAAIVENRAVIVIDGLDEVVSPDVRWKVSAAVESFITRYVLIASSESSDPIVMKTPPSVSGGNQVVLTSRVAGYHLAALQLASASHFLICPMRDDQVEDLSLKMGSLKDEQSGQRNWSEGKTGASFLAELRKQEAHVPGLERLKRNPLLLTSLFIYFTTRKRFPSSRVELYKGLIVDLAEQWRKIDQKAPKSEQVRTALEEKNAFQLLSSVAKWIQEKSSNGQIARYDLRSQYRDALPNILKLDATENEPRLIEDVVDDLEYLSSGQLGAIVSVGTDVYRFLHLTFQEYLVGWATVHEAGNQDDLVRTIRTGRTTLDGGSLYSSPSESSPLLHLPNSPVLIRLRCCALCALARKEIQKAGRFSLQIS